MNVGLPGTGIGGLFYITTALLMPLFEFVQLFRGRSSVARWRSVAAQTGMAAAILASLGITAWILSRCLPERMLSDLQLATRQINDFLGVTPTLVTLVTLSGVLLAIELFSLVSERMGGFAEGNTMCAEPLEQSFSPIECYQAIGQGAPLCPSTIPSTATLQSEADRKTGGPKIKR